MRIICPSYRWNGTLTKRTVPITRIILHHAAAFNCTAEQIHSWHVANGWVGIGYHFFIRKDGTVYEGRPLDTIGAHAGNNNYDSIGVCFEGSFDKEFMNDIQREAGRVFVESLKQRYAISKVQRHSDVNNTGCPGENFPFDYIAFGNKPDTPEKSKFVYTIGFRELAQGDNGQDVTVLQKMLIATGYSCGSYQADGIFGKATDKAVRAFQKSRNISVDGIVGKNTWYKLFLKEDCNGN